MALIDFKPSRIFLKEFDEGHTNENGDFIQGSSEWKDCGKCDVVPAGAASTITLPDGQKDRYSYVVYLPTDSRAYEYGEIIKLRILGDDTPELMVKGFHKYQLQCKLWV